MKKTFLNRDKALFTVMVQAETPQRIEELMDKSLPQGAEAFGIQVEKLLPAYRNSETYKALFSYTDKPTYVTNYRSGKNEGKEDCVLAQELLELADCGATLCDVIGDLYGKQPGELTTDPAAIRKQEELVQALHEKGAEVLMSSHILKFTEAERVLEVALAHQKRGADISKIVTHADTMEQQIENLRIVNLLKENLQIPFLFLAGGECRFLRKIGGELGCCMYLCVYEHDALSTPQQPLLRDLKAIREHI